MKNGLLTDVYSKRPKIKETIMFVFACAIFLFLTMVVLWGLSEIDFARISSNTLSGAGRGEAALPGMEFFIQMLLLFAMLLIAPLGIFFTLLFLLFWTIGMILSTKLVLSIKRIPCWMHIISAIMTVCYLIYLFLLLALMILIYASFS